jgi:hypothetical protein
MYAALTPDQRLYKQKSVSPPLTGGNDYYDAISGSSGLGEQGDQSMDDILVDSDEWLGPDADQSDDLDQRDTDCEMESAKTQSASPNQNSMSEDSSSEVQGDKDLASVLDSDVEPEGM